MLLNSLPLSGSSSAMERAAMIQTLQKRALIEKMKNLTMGISDASPKPLINPPAPDWMKDRTSVTPIQDVTPRPLINPPAPDWMRRGLQGDPIEVVAPKPLINPPAPDELKLRPLFSEDDMYVYHGTDKDIVGELKPSMDYDSFHSGISVTKDKSLAETYGKNVHKVLVSPKAKIIKFNDLEDKLIELGTSWEDVSMRKLNKLLKDEKIDGIDYESSGYLSEYGIRITNPKMLKIVKEKK